MAKYSRKSKKSIRRKSKKSIKGGGDFGPASWNSSMANPYTMYSPYDLAKDSSYPPLGALSARNINGGRRSRRRTYKNKRNIRNTQMSSKKGGTYAGTPLGTGSPVSNGAFFSTISTTGALSSGGILTGNGLSTSSEVYDNKNYVQALA